MLVAETADGSERVWGRHGERDVLYKCPGCGARVHLHKGTLKIAHFAHAAEQALCGFGAYESEDHLRAKDIMQQRFEREGRRLTSNTRCAATA